MRLQLPKDVGGTIRFSPPTMSRPSSPSVSIVDSSGVELETPSAAVDSVNTTLSAAAAADAQSVTLTSVSGVVARRHYVISDADGEREWVRVRSVNTSTRVVSLDAPLANAYDSGASFYGVDITATVSGDAAADIDEGYEARWEYTAAGAANTAITRFDVVRTAWPSPLTTLRELRSYTQLVSRDMQRAGDSDWDDVLEHATERVLEDIRARGRDPSRFRAVDPWKRVVHEAVLLHLAQQGELVHPSYRDNPDAWLDVRRRAYDEALAVTLTSAKDYDENQSGVVSAAEAARSAATIRIRL